MGKGINIDKKKSTKEKEGIFKKKSKNNMNLNEHLVEINEIKDDIVGIKEQFSQRELIQKVKDIECEVLNNIEEANLSP